MYPSAKHLPDPASYRPASLQGKASATIIQIKCFLISGHFADSSEVLGYLCFAVLLGIRVSVSK